ncbi:EscU/YscU/HrcU family type III secretion system export apparatus switch protein [Planktomarina temperata]|nr:EscU/YscU/HrcU family type III secretion system export apparatus switch protein [Planktomarina temperata]
MAEQDNSQEKTLDPTQKRLDKAKEDGEILSSKEMFVFGSSFMGLIVLFILGMISRNALTSWAALFRWDHSESLGVLRVFSSEAAFGLVLGGAAIFAFPIFAAVILTQFFVAGSINFSLKAMSFKPSRINPLSGLKRIFSVKGLVELTKSIMKIIFLIAVTGFIIWIALPKLLYLSSSSLGDGFTVFHQTLMSLVGGLVVVLAVIALGDFLWSRHEWMQKLRMNRQDMKDESKDSEGSPEVKSRIRRLQMEASQRASERAKAIENVGDATVIITNPTHFAVALKYQPETRDTPYIIAMGKGPMALRIIDEADKANISRVRSPLLARALFFTGDIGMDVAEDLFSAVASVLAYVLQLERGTNPIFEDPNIPDDLLFDEFGSKL